MKFGIDCFIVDYLLCVLLVGKCFVFFVYLVFVIEDFIYLFDVLVLCDDIDLVVVFGF